MSLSRNRIQWRLGSRGEEVEHTRNNEEEGGGGHDEVPRPVLLPKVVPPVLFRRRSTHVAFVAVAREPVHLHVAVLPPLVHSWDPTDVHDIAPHLRHRSPVHKIDDISYGNGKQ